MDLISWLKSFPDMDGEPTGKIFPGLLVLILIELIFVGTLLLILR